MPVCRVVPVSAIVLVLPPGTYPHYIGTTTVIFLSSFYFFLFSSIRPVFCPVFFSCAVFLGCFSFFFFSSSGSGSAPLNLSLLFCFHIIFFNDSPFTPLFVLFIFL